MKRSRARSPESIDFARGERATANEFATTVWRWLRNRQIHKQKFRREYPIPPYTADFCCVELKLIIEIDGASHFSAAGQDRDRVRDDFLTAQGYHVVRVCGYEVLRDANQTLTMIAQHVEQRMREIGRAKPLTPSPSPRGGARGAN